MFRAAVGVIAVLCWAVIPAGAFSKHRVAHKPDGRFLKAEKLRGDLQAAMAEALGQDHDVEFVQYDVIKQWLAPMFKALPQIPSHEGHVELRVMEHTLHRYFMKRYSLSLRPFEPHRNVTMSEMGATDLIGDRAPAFVEEILRGRFNNNGFSLDDAVSMVATMEQFLYDDTLRRIGKAHEFLFREDGASPPEEITQHMALQIIGLSIHQVQDDPQGEQAIVPPTGMLDWGTEQLIKGELERIVYKRGRRMNRAALKQHSSRHASFTLDEVAHAGHALVLAGQEYFSGCDELRKHMASLDPEKTGRAVLSDVYGNSEAMSFEVLESKDWLRRLGALDESSKWKGPQLIIPNYVSGSSNCIMTTSLYRICCPNKECESMLSHVEEAVGGHTGTPYEIMPAIINANKYDEDADDFSESPRHLHSLSRKLWEIGQHHGDQIPLNGRLFQQWMHYVKPQQCPYPHKHGSIEVVNLAGCGNHCLYADAEAAAIDASHTRPSGPLGEEEAKEGAWMSQWAFDDEELVVPAEALSNPLHSQMGMHMKSFSAAMLLAIGFFAFSLYGFKAAGLLSSKKGAIRQAPSSAKSHMV